MENVEILRTIDVQGHKLPIYGTIEEPLFLAVDVAKMIDFSVGNTSHMLNTIDSDEKKLLSTRSSNTTARGSASNKWFLTEYGFYEVLMQSRKPIARRFKSSVKKILKNLRLTNQGDIEDWLNGPDPLVDEWETYCRDNDEDMEFSDWLKEFKGYTDDML